MNSESEHEGDVQPRKVAIAFLEAIELGLLAEPEYPQRHEAHEVSDHARRKSTQRRQEVVFGMNRFRGRRAQVEHEQRHGYREDPVGERREAVQVRSRNPVVERAHRYFGCGPDSDGRRARLRRHRYHASPTGTAKMSTWIANSSPRSWPALTPT